jgi:hypothetical protein
MKDANTILEQDVCGCADDVATAEDYYIENAGEMEPASESQFSTAVLELLADQFISPVQSVTTIDGETHYGVIEYENGDEWYGFYAHDDRAHGRRVIGIREAPAAEKHNDLPHVSAGDRSGSHADNVEASYDELVATLSDHYGEKYGTERDTPAQSGPPDHIDVGVPPRAGPPQK